MKNFGIVFLMILAAASSFAVTAQKKLETVSVKQPILNSASIEQSVLDEINAARSDPQKYIKYLEDYRKLFKGNLVDIPNQSQLQTNEGTVVIDEAIAFLKQLTKLEPYKFSNGLNQSAKTHLTDLMENDTLGHRGKDGSDPTVRMKRFGRFGSINAENISYFAQDARQIVMMMIIDDGWKSRSHRKNIFSPQLKVVGIAFGTGKTRQGLCVINFADSFSDSSYKGVREF